MIRQPTRVFHGTTSVGITPISGLGVLLQHRFIFSGLLFWGFGGFLKRRILSSPWSIEPNVMLPGTPSQIGLLYEDIPNSVFKQEKEKRLFLEHRLVKYEFSTLSFLVGQIR